MSKQPWSQDPVARGVVAVLLAATMVVATQAGAHPLSENVARDLGPQVVTSGMADEGPQADELDPTDDGAIIIECVAFAGRGASDANARGTNLWVRTVAVPQYPLGPSTCSPKEHKRA